MKSCRKSSLLSTTMMPLVVAAGVATGGTLAGVAFCRPAEANAASPENPEAAAKPGKPVNPCAAARPGAVQTAANACDPCAPCNACAPCDPCAPCSPCSPCDPCAADDPCGAADAATECYVERLQEAAEKSDPCAPADPCAADDPCAPCSPCGPCGPCAPGDGAELEPQEATDLYECMLDDLRDAYARSGNEHAEAFLDWPRYSERPYVSATHGGRYVQNYANETAEAYGDFEDAGTMPEGSVLAKDSLTVSDDGQGMIGPLFLMEKMEEGFHEASDDWRYTLIQPDGQIVGTTQGEGSENVEFCIACHMQGSQTDSMMFLPDELRAQP